VITPQLVHHEIAPTRAALLVVDVTGDFVRPDSPMYIPMSAEIVPRLRAVAEACRRLGGHVAYCGYAFREGSMARMDDFWPPIRAGALAPESAGVEVIDELRPEPGDVVVEKSTYSVFYGTLLEEELRSRDVDTVLVGGVATNYACYLTAREAQCRNFKVVFLSDGACTFDLPDAGFGPVSIDQIQRAFLTTIAYGCGDVMSADEAIRAMEGAGNGTEPGLDP
jgi:ureidoacrylate peracid hydrolase